MVERVNFKREHGGRERARQQAGGGLQHSPPWKTWRLRRDAGGQCCLASLPPPSIMSQMKVSGCAPRLEPGHRVSSIPPWLRGRSGGEILSSCSRNPSRESDVIGLRWGLGMGIFKKLPKDFNLQPRLGTTGELVGGRGQLYRRSPGEAWTQPG